MDNSKNKALEIAIELTKTKLQSSDSTASKTNGVSAVEFFTEIYNGIKPIIESIDA